MLISQQVVGEDGAEMEAGSETVTEAATQTEAVAHLFDVPLQKAAEAEAAFDVVEGLGVQESCSLLQWP